MKRKKLLLLIIICIVLIVFLGIFIKSLKTKQDTPISITAEIDEKTEKKIKEERDEALIKKLSEMSEQKRMEFYASQFFKKLDNKKFDSAYEFLNGDFKNNYFKTSEDFSKYMKEFWPKETSIKYNNMERLGNIYVLEVEVTDILNRKNANDFECYVVIKENYYDDIELSFSVDSAMGDEYQETEEE